MAKLDVEMKKSDDLLSQMMPKSVAEKIKVSISFLSRNFLFFSLSWLTNIICNLMAALS